MRRAALWRVFARRGALLLGAAASALAMVSLAGAGCGGAGGAPGGAGGAAGGGGSVAGEIDRPCAEASRLGGFELVMVAPTATVEGYAQLIGSVRDKVDPTRVWKAALTEGDCRLMVGPTCSTSCALPSVCDGAACVPGPTTKTVGTVTVTGLNAALSATPNSQKSYYAPVPAGGFPPVASGAAVVLTASGADYAGFSLLGGGFPSSSHRRTRFRWRWDGRSPSPGHPHQLRPSPAWS